MLFRLFRGTHVRIAKQGSYTPPNHVSLKPCLSFDPCIYVLCSKGRNAKRRIKVQTTCRHFFYYSRAAGLVKLPTKTITLFHTCVWISHKVPVLSLQTAKSKEQLLTLPTH